jgi:hypothetical protein
VLPLISAMERAATSDCRLAKAQNTGVGFMVGEVGLGRFGGVIQRVLPWRLCCGATT